MIMPPSQVEPGMLSRRDDLPWAILLVTVEVDLRGEAAVAIRRAQRLVPNQRTGMWKTDMHHAFQVEARHRYGE